MSEGSLCVWERVLPRVPLVSLVSGTPLLGDKPPSFELLDVEALGVGPTQP